MVVAASPAAAPAATGGYVGLANQGATCYLNSLLQTLFMTPEFTRELFRWRLDPAASEEARVRSIPHQLQMLFARLLTSERRSISTVELTKSFRWDAAQAFVQHDVQELCRLLFDALEQAFAGTADVTRLFRGELVDFLACKPPHTHESARNDAFMDLQLAVRSFGSARPIASVVEGLRNFLAPESLEGSNQYELAPGQKVDAWKGLRLAELPPLLTVHLKRFELDYTTMRNVKINDRVVFGETLRFAKGLCPSSATGATAAGGGVGAEGWSPLEPEAAPPPGAAAGSAALLEYELYSVLVHAGTATSGHYYAYIKDLSRCALRAHTYNPLRLPMLFCATPRVERKCACPLVVKLLSSARL
jgi:ubiquitin carboxyl-terminal hydrolase 47